MASYLMYHSFLSTRFVIFTNHYFHRPSQFLFVLQLGLFAFAFATKAQRKFRDGFVMESHQLNKRALILSILSILCGIALIIGLLFGFDAWPRTNG